MKIKKVISKSKDGNRMEVIAEGQGGYLCTLHIHRHSDGWKYHAGRDRKGQPILKLIEEKG